MRFVHHGQHPAEPTTPSESKKVKLAPAPCRSMEAGCRGCWHAGLVGDGEGTRAASMGGRARGSGGDRVREVRDGDWYCWERENNCRHGRSTPLNLHAALIVLGTDPTANKGCIASHRGSKSVLIYTYI
jgi:hypothetical protein